MNPYPLAIGVFYNQRLNKLFIIWSTYPGEYIECCTGLPICEHSFEDMYNKYAVYIGDL